MINFSYNLSNPLKKEFLHLDDLQKQILLCKISPQQELKIRWENTLEKIYFLKLLSGEKIDKKELTKILSYQEIEVKKREQKIRAIKKIIDRLYFDWFLSSKNIEEEYIIGIYEKIYLTRLHINNQSFKELLFFLNKNNEQTVIKAGISYSQILFIAPFPAENLEMAFLTSQIFLYKSGYDFRGLLNLPRYFWENRGEYEEILNKTRDNGNLTLWLEFFAGSIAHEAEKILIDLENSKHNYVNTDKFWSLTDRQKEILSILDDPKMRLTNRKIQQIFKISQITSSRDLSRLTKLGFLLQSGRGRSVYYTRI